MEVIQVLSPLYYVGCRVRFMTELQRLQGGFSAYIARPKVEVIHYSKPAVRYISRPFHTSVLVRVV